MDRDPLVVGRRRCPAGAVMAVALLACGVPGAMAQPGREAPRVELAGTTAMTAIFPSIGAIATVRPGRRVAVEAGLDVLPWMIEDGDEAVLLAFAQARVPWRETPGRRRSVLVGLTGAALVERNWVPDGPDGTLRGTRRRVRWTPLAMPHVGFAWQWRTDRTVQLRLDVVAMVPLLTPVPIPRVGFGVAWAGLRSAS